MSNLSHSPSTVRQNDTCQVIQTSSPLSNFLLLPFTSTYTQCERPSFTPTKNNRQIWSYAASRRKYAFKHSNGPAVFVSLLTVTRGFHLSTEHLCRNDINICALQDRAIKPYPRLWSTERRCSVSPVIEFLQLSYGAVLGIKVS